MNDFDKATEATDEKMVKETLFADLDKGINDMEADRMQEVDEAFRMIGKRLDEES